MTVSTGPAKAPDIPARGTSTLDVHLTGVPARNLPAGMWSDVLELLRAHGFDPDAPMVISALYDLIRATPVERGGRLLPDGSVSLD